MNRSFLYIISLFLMQITTVCAAEKKTLSLNDEGERVSYSLGHQIGEDFRKHNVSPSAVLFLRGLQDAYAKHITRANQNALLSW